MQSTELSLTAKTLYAELRELAIAIGATENIGDSPGTITSKAIGGKRYLYFQFRDLDGTQRQAYLGQEGPELDSIIERIRSRSSERQEDASRINELGRAFVGAGGYALDHTAIRVLKGFADAGIFQPGSGYGVLVGTYAFNALGNALGVRWGGHMMTQDIDVAAPKTIDIALTRPTQSAPDVLEQLGMGFMPVPTLNHLSPSTSFRVRGKDLRVDLLAPLVGPDTGKPIHVPALNAPAHPVRFMDYLIEDAVPHVLVGQKQQILCNLPSPARFALHKLIVSESRTEVFATKAAKDRLQAIQMLEVLLWNSPDSVGVAAELLVRKGKGWLDRVSKALVKCEEINGEVAGEIRRLLGR